jgi:CRP/FNR family transcriptional regulator
MNTINPMDCDDCPFLDRAVAARSPGEPAPIPGMRRLAYSAGELVFREGDAIEGIHCIHTGLVGLVKNNGELVVAAVPSRDLLGVPDIVTGDRHQNGALALEDTSLCFIPKGEALRILRRQPAILVDVMRRLCDRIRAMERIAEPG